MPHTESPAEDGGSVPSPPIGVAKDVPEDAPESTKGSPPEAKPPEQPEAEPAARAPIRRPHPDSPYGSQETCEQCGDRLDCVFSFVGGGEKLFGCGAIDAQGTHAILSTEPPPTAEGHMGGSQYDFYGKDGRLLERWVLCAEASAGCTATFQFFERVPGVALYNYGETGGGGSTYGLVDLETGKRKDLLAERMHVRALSPSGQRLAYEDAYDYVAGQVSGSFYCLDLERRRERVLMKGTKVPKKLSEEHEFALEWLDDTRIRVELRQGVNEYLGEPGETVWTKTLRCPS